jgi:hypothetical protein
LDHYLLDIVFSGHLTQGVRIRRYLATSSAGFPNCLLKKLSLVPFRLGTKRFISAIEKPGCNSIMANGRRPFDRVVMPTFLRLSSLYPSHELFAQYIIPLITNIDRLLRQNTRNREIGPATGKPRPQMASTPSARYGTLFRLAAGRQSQDNDDYIAKPRRQQKSGRRARFIGEDSPSAFPPEPDTRFQPHDEHFGPDQSDRECRQFLSLQAQHGDGAGEFSRAGFPPLETARVDEPPGPFCLLARGHHDSESPQKI